ncbi:transposase [Streptomyces sp. AC627_RSS907]|uniref:transposase n=1 Tax=Streptomyces sp. AC627_RSS907 TaxID=2823684 RepID=UPI0035AE1861
MVDDVPFPKRGTASVGVARPYCGAVGRQANQQVAVSVLAAADTVFCSLNREFYLPRE